MQPKLGILAGSGDLPVRIIETCCESGREFFVVSFEGQTPSSTVFPRSGREIPHVWIHLGEMGLAIDNLHQNEVVEIVMAGAVKRPSLTNLEPDTWTAAFLEKIGHAAYGDDALFSALIQALEQDEGFRVVGAESLLPDIKAKEGPYGRIEPDDLARRDIARGIDVALQIGRMDVGQGAVVQEGVVLAVEALEHTDAMLDRCRDLHRDGPGGVLVKVSKPGQEDRADLPAIGVTTVQNAKRAGLRGIAVEAGGALIIDPEAVGEAANAAGLFVIGVDVKDRT